MGRGEADTSWAYTNEGRRGNDLTLVQYWDAEEIPDYIADELRTFTDLNPGFRHLVFSQAAAEEFIAEHFTPREVAAFRSCAIPAMQSDYFRFCAGFVFDGIYSDVDFRCIAPLDPLIPDPGSIRLFRGPAGNVISGFFAFRSPGHPFLELALEIATTNIERRFPDKVYFATGPPIFMALVALYVSGSRDGSIAPFKDRPLQKAVRAYWEVIGDQAKVTAALSGVEIFPSEAYLQHVQPSHDLAYKKTDSHWLNAKGDIFRTQT